MRTLLNSPFLQKLCAYCGLTLIFRMVKNLGISGRTQVARRLPMPVPPSKTAQPTRVRSMLTVNRLDIADAGVIIAAAAEKARDINVPMCIAVTDESGNLIALERMDGGKITSITIAIDKAFTAAAAKKATHEYGVASQPGAPAFGINTAIGGRLMVVGGGVPISDDTGVVGAIGVSSGTPAQDLDVAQAGVDAFERARLPNMGVGRL